MKPFSRFTQEDKSFWFFIRFVSEKLGYSKNGEIRREYDFLNKR